MLLSRQEKVLLKTFVNKKFPAVFYLDGNESIVELDAQIAGQCYRLLGGWRLKKMPCDMVSEEGKEILERNANNDEVRNYCILLNEVVSILNKYRK